MTNPFNSALPFLWKTILFVKQKEIKNKTQQRTPGDFSLKLFTEKSTASPSPAVTNNVLVFVPIVRIDNIFTSFAGPEFSELTTKENKYHILAAIKPFRGKPKLVSQGNTDKL